MSLQENNLGEKHIPEVPKGDPIIWYITNATPYSFVRANYIPFDYVWILTDGFWVDENHWLDTEFWTD